ncbi:hypothetical protein V6O07_02615, partial [Arthrospira platensis SPKY2]
MTFDDNSVGNSIILNFATLPVGCAFDLEYEADLALGVAPGSQLNNMVSVGWSSLPGTGTFGNPTGSNTPGASGAQDGERVYSANSSAMVEIASVVLSKAAILGSDPATTLPNVAIGETISYELTITLPFGT